MNSNSTQFIARHNVGPVAEWQTDFDHVQKLRETTHRPDLQAGDVGHRFKDELRLALIAALFPAQKSAGHSALARAAGAAHAAILAQNRWRTVGGGGISLTEPGQPRQMVAAGDAGLSYPDWVNGFAAALIVRDQAAITSLGAVSSLDACARPAGTLDDFWPFYCGALAAAVIEPDAAPRWLAEAEQAGQTAQIIEPALLQLTVLPHLPLIGALARGDAAAFNAALVAALSSWQQYFARPQQQRNWHGLLALPAAALSAAAVERGLRVEIDSEYLPPEFISGGFTRTLTGVTYHYPRRSIDTADEARWFLDLDSIPRAARQHAIIEENGQLLARYQISNVAGLAHAEADFVLPAAGGQSADRPQPALGPAELLYLAEAYSRQPAADASPPARRQQRANLVEAINCVKTALERLSTENEAPLFYSERGQAMFEAEPGRFQPERLAAYLSALTGELNKIEAALPPGPAAEEDSEAAARAAAMLSIGVIREQVLPLLRALAADTTGELAAQLQPRPEDYARVFVGEAVEAARAGYTQLWGGGPPRVRPVAPIELQCHVAPAGFLAEENELSAHFPAGYRAIARWLNPQRVWVAWKYIPSGQSAGQAFNGLVWVEDHWAWFPKPFRVLRQISG